MNTVAVRTALAVIIAGVVGTIFNAVALALAMGPDRLSLALVPGRYLVAIAVCAGLPVLDRFFWQARFWLAAIAWLTVAPSLLAKFVFGVEAGWAIVLAFNLIYALAAVATYRIIAGPHGRALDRRMMAERKSVLFIGLDPLVVDYGRWPGLTEEKLRAALQADRDALEAAGYDVTICFIDRGETAERTIEGALAKRRYEAVMIGAGVRKDVEHFLLFEKAINVVHRHAPNAWICFNTGPTDSAAAVRRWV